MEDISCRICLDEVAIDPVSATCQSQHIVCFKCVFGNYRYNINNQQVLACPECRHGPGSLIVHPHISTLAKEILDRRGKPVASVVTDDRPTSKEYFCSIDDLSKRFPEEFAKASNSCIITVDQMALFVCNYKLLKRIRCDATASGINENDGTGDGGREIYRWRNKYNSLLPTLIPMPVVYASDSRASGREYTHPRRVSDVRYQNSRRRSDNGGGRGGGGGGASVSSDDSHGASDVPENETGNMSLSSSPLVVVTDNGETDRVVRGATRRRMNAGILPVYPERISTSVPSSLVLPNVSDGDEDADIGGWTASHAAALAILSESVHQFVEENSLREADSSERRPLRFPPPPPPSSSFLATSDEIRRHYPAVMHQVIEHGVNSLRRTEHGRNHSVLSAINQSGAISTELPAVIPALSVELVDIIDNLQTTLDQVIARHQSRAVDRNPDTASSVGAGMSARDRDDTSVLRSDDDRTGLYITVFGENDNYDKIKATRSHSAAYSYIRNQPLSENHKAVVSYVHIGRVGSELPVTSEIFAVTASTTGETWYEGWQDNLTGTNVNDMVSSVHTMRIDIAKTVIDLIRRFVHAKGFDQAFFVDTLLTLFDNSAISS